MNWLMELCDVPSNKLLNISIPKEKLAKNIKSEILRGKMIYELQNIQDIIYHAIYRKKADTSRDELHVIEVALFEPKYIKIIAEAFQTAIPYSKLLIFSSGEKYVLFYAGRYDKSLTQAQFTRWIYKEEIGLYSDQSSDLYAADFQNPWGEIIARFKELFRNAEMGEYICLRHLLDNLRMLEVKEKTAYIRPVVLQLISEDRIMYFDGEPFVTHQDADQCWIQSKCTCWESGIEDKRFGIDRKFALLDANDFATTDATRALLDRLKSEYLFPEYDQGFPNDK